MADQFSRVFTLEVDERPVLAFEAHVTREAQSLCKEAWLREDLASLKSGSPHCSLPAPSCQCGQPPLRRRPPSADGLTSRPPPMIWSSSILSNWTAARRILQPDLH